MIAGAPGRRRRLPGRIPLRPRALLCLVCCLAMCLAPPAWAEEQNLVDTGQLPDSSFIYSTSIFDLQTSDTYYESQTVQITGEVVGDLIYDGAEEGRRWITVDSLPDEQPASVQVLVSAEQAELIDTYGRYQVRGSTVSIMGTYHLVCGQHDGIADLHATSLTVMQPGYVDAAEFSAGAFVPALGLALLGLALFLLYRHRREELR